ncbi:MAG: helicase-related protein [Reinekea sp.]
MLPKNFNEPMGAPAIFEKQIEIKLLHPASTLESRIQDHGSTRISGSKATDMKAAIVDHFKSDNASLLISTEAGAEGINLQFCSVLINFDLPWNPKKIEQRIGRVHRYGQKNDVVVVNFVNRRNRADERAFNILNSKLKLFEGVFGASDEVLGAISSSIDIEKSIYEIYQTCRTDEAIEEGFNKLQEKLSPILEVKEEATRQTLLNQFDPDVIRKLKNTRDESRDFLEGYQQVLLDLARAGLTDAQFERNYFIHQGQRYDLNWTLAQENDSEFFRLQATEHFLAWDLVRAAKKQSLASAHLQFCYSKSHTGRYGALTPYIGQTGVLRVLEIIFTFNHAKNKENSLAILAQTENGEQLSEENAEHLLFIPAKTLETEINLPEHIFDTWQQQVEEERKAINEEKLAEYLEQEADKANDRRQAYEQTIKSLDEEIRQFKKDTRQLGSAAEKIAARKNLRRLESKRDEAMADYHESKKDIERDEDKLLDEVSAKLESSCTVNELFTIRWSLVE